MSRHKEDFFFFLSKTCLLSDFILSHIQRHLIKHPRDDDKASVRLCRTDKPFLGRFYRLLGPRLRRK